MNKHEIGLLEIINTMLTARKCEPLNEITSDLELTDGLGFTSLDLAELTARIEAQYGIDVYADRIIHTIGEVVSQLESAKT